MTGFPDTLLFWLKSENVDELKPFFVDDTRTLIAKHEKTKIK